MRNNLPREPFVVVDALGQFPSIARCDSLDALTENAAKIKRVSLFARPNELYHVLNYALAYRWSLVIDEIDYYLEPHYGDEMLRRLHNKMSFVARYGRHRIPEVIAATRAPAEIPRYLTRNAGRMIIFHMHEPADIRYFRAVGKISDEQIEQMQILADHNFLDIRFDAKKIG